MDCSIVQSDRYPEFFVISTTDFFYPLVEDPYLQGRVGCANVLSDMYALGMVDIDNVLMILAASREMRADARDIVTKQMMLGFNACCEDAGTRVTGGQSVLNPWPIIGGVAKTIAKETDFIRPEFGQPGDVIVLTKPLGTQLAVNVREWQVAANEKWAKCSTLISDKDALRAFNIAVGSMIRLNRNGARLMHKYHSHGATDVTGFGILGHADNLAKNQKEKVEIVIHTLPIIAGMKRVSEEFRGFGLLEGRSAETSGGLFVILPADAAEAFCREIEELDGWPAWVIGDVNATDGEQRAVIAGDVATIEVGGVCEMS